MLGFTLDLKKFNSERAILSVRDNNFENEWKNIEGMKGTKLFVGIFVGTYSYLKNRNGTLLKSFFF